MPKKKYEITLYFLDSVLALGLRFLLFLSFAFYPSLLKARIFRDKTHLSPVDRKK